MSAVIHRLVPVLPKIKSTTTNFTNKVQSELNSNRNEVEKLDAHESD